MTGYRDRDHFDRLQDARAEHVAETGEWMTLAEAQRKLLPSSPAPGWSVTPPAEHRTARAVRLLPLDDPSAVAPPPSTARATGAPTNLDPSE